MMNRYSLIYEVTDECDFHLYYGHRDEQCASTAELALVDNQYEEHLAHLCMEHGPIILKELEV
jgi:hypothetical protein